MPDENEELDSSNQPAGEAVKTDDTDTETVYEPVESDEIEAEKLRELNKKLFERAKKAEAEAKALKMERAKLDEVSKSAQDIKAQLNPELIAKEIRLLATLEDEEITEAKDIARGKNISLEEALKTKSFLAFQRELKIEERKEKAKLSASKGSSQEEQKSFKPGLTADEHKALWKEAMGG